MPFRVLVCGDSIAWGQGLEDHQKYSTLVEDFLRARWNGLDIERQTLAHSGSIIGIERASGMELAIDQEVPVDDPTIFHQIAHYRDKPGEAAEVVLLLINGGINDVDIRTILNPTTAENDLRNRTSKHCYEDMLALLSESVQVFPNARIIVTGYYQIVSHQTDPFFIPAFAAVFGLILAGIPGVIVGGGLSIWAQLAVINNCEVFATAANLSLQGAVDEVNRVLGAKDNEPRVALAIPAFQPQNSFMAPESYLFGLKLTADPTEPFLPIDSVLGARIDACHTARNSGRIKDYRQCKLASAGHPNVKGAQAYTDVIFPILDNWILESWRPESHNALYSWLPLLLS